LSELVGMPIEWLCEVHGAKTKHNHIFKD